MIDAEEGQRGVVSTAEALDLATEAGLDLVEIAPQADPPVCKILDYGKYRFEQEKRTKDARKKQKLMKLREVRMQPMIEKHDIRFKTKKVKEFLDEGNKVKITVRFRGRQLAHTEIGKDTLSKILEALDDLYKSANETSSYSVDRSPSMEGRFMSMILNPKIKRK